MSDLSRYSRQVVLREVGVNGQQLLRDSSVLVIGLGGLGCAASLYLAGAGIGRLVLADRDRVDRSNLQSAFSRASGSVTSRMHGRGSSIGRLGRAIRWSRPSPVVISS